MASKTRGPWSVALTILYVIAVIMEPLAPSAHGARVGKRTPSGKMAALLIIDVQDCFLSGGSLAVSQGKEVIPVINWIRETFKEQFSLVVLTKDWHCNRHVSFASSHPGRPFDEVTLKYTPNGTLCLEDSITSLNFPEAVNCSSTSQRPITQALWPDHCVKDVSAGPTSSKLDTQLHREPGDVIVTKGTDCQIDYYSTFYDIGRFGMTNLHSILQSAGIDTLIVTGLALDYCVKYTAIDGQYLGYDVYVIKDATRAVADDATEALREMDSNGVDVIDSVHLHAILFGAAPRIASLSPVVVISWVSVYLVL